MALAARTLDPHNQRKVRLFDSFEGLPPPSFIDGARASRWGPDDTRYHDNCEASLGLVKHNLRALGIASVQVEFHPGWFQETVPRFVREHPQAKIAILRLDGDWYESTKVCLENLYDLVSDRGYVIIDDYYHWEGCAQAVHEFLGSHGGNHRLMSLPDFSSAYLVKSSFDLSARRLCNSTI